MPHLCTSTSAVEGAWQKTRKLKTAARRAGMEERESDPEGGFSRERHVALMEMMAEELPGEYATQEVNRLTLAYFALSSLSILRALHRVPNPTLIPPNSLHFVDRSKQEPAMRFGTLPASIRIPNCNFFFFFLKKILDKCHKYLVH